MAMRWLVSVNPSPGTVCPVLQGGLIMEAQERLGLPDRLPFY